MKYFKYFNLKRNNKQKAKWKKVSKLIINNQLNLMWPLLEDAHASSSMTIFVSPIF